METHYGTARAGPTSSASVFASLAAAHDPYDRRHDVLLAPVTEAEVQRSLKRCHRGKACGPDGLTNGWYRAHDALLAPMLTHLFNTCMVAGVTPTTFVEANIFCLPKTSKPQSGLDFRPIALLNTDYKVFSRIFSLRIRPLLPRLLH
ncbi:TPA: hypothetical protein N0F65_005375, partial [Lagenidium giganteum]